MQRNKPLNLTHINLVQKSIKNPSRYTTVSDICIKTGLPYAYTEKIIVFLVSSYKGHLSVTEKGHLMFKFPNGFDKNIQKTNTLSQIIHKVKHGAVDTTKKILKSWISLMLLFYLTI